MNRWIECVREFHEKFGQPINDIPAIYLNCAELRHSLIREECDETLEAISHNNVTETADGLVDLIYVAIGTALSFGIDLEPIFDAVHASNMAKENGGTSAKGKILKPNGWQPPCIAELLEAQCKK